VWYSRKRFLCLRASWTQPKIPFQPSMMLERKLTQWSISRSGWAFSPPLCCFPPFVLFTSLPLKIGPKGAMPPLWEPLIYILRIATSTRLNSACQSRLNFCLSRTFKHIITSPCWRAELEQTKGGKHSKRADDCGRKASLAYSLNSQSFKSFQCMQKAYIHAWCTRDLL